MRKGSVRQVLLALALMLAFTTAGSAQAAVTFQTQRASLDNVDDVAGRWQHEGGRLLLNGQHVANYIIVRRVTFSGTSPQNTAAVTMTLFFLGASPPRNMTLQGSHDFNSGRYVGSVSAAALTFLGIHQGSRFEGDTAAGTLKLGP